MNRLRLPIAAMLLAGLMPLSGRGQEAYYRPQLKAKDIDLALGIDWYGVYLQGKKVGTCRIELARADKAVVENFSMTMKLVVSDVKTEVKMARVLTFEEAAPHRLLKAVLDQNDGDTVTKITATRVAKGFDYVLVVAGKERRRIEPEPMFTLADNLASDVWMRSEPKVGAKILSSDLDIEDWKLDPSTFTIKSIKHSLVGGLPVKYYEVETESKRQNIKYMSRFDSKGNMLSSNIGIFELRKETEEQAKNIEYSQDLFVLGSVKIDRPIGRTTRLIELVLEVVGKDGDVLQNGPSQTVRVVDDKRLLELGKKFGHEQKPTAKEIADNLAETNAYAINDAKVKELAKKAIGDAKAPEEKVKRIVAFVHDFMIPTDTATLPNIHDLLEHKKGDCKSYALLTTTLCRSAGIPSREVAGLLYMGDDAKAFGGHAWNEVVLGGAWVPVDATLNEVGVDAGHICFGEDRVASGAMLQSLGKLSFKVVSVKASK